MKTAPLLPSLLIPALLLGILSPAIAQQPKDIAKKTLPSVVMLVMTDAQGRPQCLGSGFVVADGIVATNLHVIEDAAKGYVRIVGESRHYRIEKAVGVDSDHDLALLKVGGVKAKSLKLSDSSKVVVGDEIYAVGNPEGFDGTFSNGLVSGIRRERGDTLLQITAPISHGSSGGPVLNARGEVVGIAVAYVEDGQNLNFAIPSNVLTALMKNHKLLPTGDSAAPAKKASAGKARP